MARTRTQRDFLDRPPGERDLLLHVSCCAYCEVSDFALLYPEEYELDGQVFLSGFCPRCDGECITEIIELPRASG